MVFLAEGLPVTSIPEQFLVPTMRNDMVNDRSFSEEALPFTYDAERICIEVLLARLLPRTVVPTTCYRPDFLRMQGLVLLTVFCPTRHKFRATGMAAGYLRSAWYAEHLPRVELEHIPDLLRCARFTERHFGILSDTAQLSLPAPDPWNLLSGGSRHPAFSVSLQAEEDQKRIP